MPADVEPPRLRETSPRPVAAPRVAIGLVVFGLLQGIEGITDLVLSFKAGGTINLLAPFGFLWLWAAAMLVWTDKRIIWPLLTYFSALALGCLAGSIVGAGLGLPAKLLGAVRAAEPRWFWLYAVYAVAFSGLLLWLLLEGLRTRTAWPQSLPYPKNRWLQPPALGSYLLAPCAAFAWGILLLLQGSWTAPAIVRARQEYGNGYEYMTLNYNVTTTKGHTTHRAVVLAYSQSELHEIPLSWDD